MPNPIRKYACAKSNLVYAQAVNVRRPSQIEGPVVVDDVIVDCWFVTPIPGDPEPMPGQVLVPDDPAQPWLGGEFVYPPA